MLLDVRLLDWDTLEDLGQTQGFFREGYRGQIQRRGEATELKKEKHSFLLGIFKIGTPSCTPLDQPLLLDVCPSYLLSVFQK